MGGVLRWFGGVAVDRSKSNNFVEATAAVFETHPDFKLCITPEGTRSRVEKLKTGFYWIARTAGSTAGVVPF